MSKELTIKQRARRAAKTWRERPGPIDTSPKWAMLADIIAAEFAPLAGKNEKLTADNDILGAIWRFLTGENDKLQAKLADAEWSDEEARAEIARLDGVAAKAERGRKELATVIIAPGDGEVIDWSDWPQSEILDSAKEQEDAFRKLCDYPEIEEERDALKAKLAETEKAAYRAQCPVDCSKCPGGRMPPEEAEAIVDKAFTTLDDLKRKATGFDDLNAKLADAEAALERERTANDILGVVRSVLADENDKLEAKLAAALDALLGESIALRQAEEKETGQ